jgi:uncharacterized membrane protein YfcA
MPPLADLLIPVLLLLATGAFAGVIAGMLGVGGGLVLVPALFHVFGAAGYDGPQLMQLCLATSLATIVATGARSVAGHARKGAVDRGILRRWGPWIAAGALGGTVAAASLRSEVLQAVFAGLAMLAGLYMAFGRAAWRLGPAMPAGAGRAGLGSALGFFSVLMGIGGGTFGVPLMTLYGVPIHRAIGTAAGIGLIIAVPAVLAFLAVPVSDAPPGTVGAVNLPAFALVVAATLLTTHFGVRLAHATDPAPLKRLFAVFVLVVAANMVGRLVLE